MEKQENSKLPKKPPENSKPPIYFKKDIKNIEVKDEEEVRLKEFHFQFKGELNTTIVVQCDNIPVFGNYHEHEDLKILDSDIATIEELYNLLIDGEGYPLGHPTLIRSRELTAKLYKIVGFDKAKGKR